MSKNIAPGQIIVQCIQTRWTKKSRGGSAAVRRNAVPESSRLPQGFLRAEFAPLLCHTVYYDSHNDFTVSGREIEAESHELPFVIGCVTVGLSSDAVVDSRLFLRFEYNRQHGGAPDRSWIEKTLYLHNGQWGQIVYSGRFSYEEGGWWYQKTVINAALDSVPLTSTTLFTRRIPDERFLAMGHLF